MTAKYEQFVDEFNLTKNTDDDVVHHLLSLSAETGELLGIFSKRLRGLYLSKDETLAEMSDILFHLTACCNGYGITLEELQQINMKKLEARKKNGTLVGNKHTRGE